LPQEQGYTKPCSCQLVSVVLYGSKARGDFTEESDIDVKEFQRLASIKTPFATDVMEEGETLWTN